MAKRSQGGGRKALLMSCTYEGVANDEWGELKNAYKDVDSLRKLLYREFSLRMNA